MANLNYFYIAMCFLWYIIEVHSSSNQRLIDEIMNKSKRDPSFDPNIIRNLMDISLDILKAEYGGTSGEFDVYSWYTNFLYKKKIKEVEKLEAEDNPTKFEWLRKANQFNKNSTGIIFTGKMDPKVLASDFCRVIVLEQGNSSRILLNAMSGTKYNSTCLKAVFLQSFHDVHPISTIKLAETNSVILVDVKLDATLRFSAYYGSNLKVFGHKHGYSLDADDCERSPRISNELKEYLYEILVDSKSLMYNFVFQETLESIQAGATRMFRKRMVLFEVCRMLVLGHRNPTDRIELGFTLANYHKTKDFYKSPRDMQVFVKYINLLSNWSKIQKNTVVFLGLDVDTSSKNDFFNNISVGWYSYDNISKRFITKQEQALNLSINKFTKFPPPSGLSNHNIILIVAVPLVFVILILVSAFFFVRNYYKSIVLTNDEIHKFLHGNQNGEGDEYLKVPFDQEKYKIPEGSFTIEDDKPLGSGEFGRVCRGTITKLEKEINVAVTYPNPFKFDKTIVYNLLSEIKVLAYLDKHQHIAELLGANISKLRQGKVYIFLELCELGSLESYLRNIVEQSTIDANSTLDAMLYEDMYRWSTEICHGMSYLAERHVVHADLATRNVLLNLQKEAKLCDFGLSKRMLYYKNYVITKQEASPWKWMAPESLVCNKFSEKSDVWAFGVTLWEIYSLGDIPYPELSWEVDFPQKLEKGLHLPEPKYNEKDMYTLMTKCWNIIPNERPSFSDVQILLGNTEKHENELQV